ncbi:MAG: DNA polymerase III subunit alpha [Deltaproteobacteria bacterium]|nr:DNA polymerase III subunit alpha [Deltaproteobacteria bacterium]
MVLPVVRSHFSLMRGIASPKALARRAKALGYHCLALADRDNLYGLWEFGRACRENGLRPITGSEVTSPHGAARAWCLVESAQGFASLCRLLTRRHTEEGFDLARAVGEEAEGLSVLTDDAALLAVWRKRGVPAMAALPRKPTGAPLELRRLARRVGAPMAALAGACFLEPSDRQRHMVLRAIAANTSLSRLGPSGLAPPDAVLAGPSEYASRFAPLPEALHGAAALIGRLSFVPKPGITMPPWHDAQGRGADQVLKARAYAGAAQRYGEPLPGEVVARLEHELGIIAGKGFSSYFLVVEDIVTRSPRICGRGSGAASLVAFSLGITNVCPIKFNLYFERFINPQRVDPPDIDVDFAWDERDRVIESVLKQYQGRSAMVATHIFFQGRMAIREVAKVYGLPAREIKRVMRHLPWLRGPVEGHTGFYPKRQALPPGAKADLAAPWPEVLAAAQSIVGIPRHISVHVGGVVITPGPIDRHAPLEIAPKGVPIIQWEKEGAEEAGLVKIDLLGNRSLAVIRDAVAEVKAGGHAFDEAGWQPEDDPVTQKLVSQGRTMGCFYIESPATRLLQEKAARGDYERLVIHSSIIRPAANDYIQEYLHRLHGAPWQHIHPLLEPILAETYGIMVYQEQVSQAAGALAGFSHAEGDRLRKVMTWKDKGRALSDYRQKFEDGALARGVSPACIDEVWSMMMSFAGYSFCKPHSASYARVSFQAAYLKAHFPAEFMAAVISNQGGFYSAFAYVSEARRLGLTVLPPCVNRSRAAWSGQSRQMRVGLMAVKGLGRGTMGRIIAGRRQRPYTGFDDFLLRVRPAEDEARSLIHAGAFSELHPGADPAELLWRLARTRRLREAAAKERGLFSAPPPVNAPSLPPGDQLERLRRQYAVLGFLPSRHPMVLFAEGLRGRKIIKARDLARHIGRRVRLAGWLLTGKTVWTKSEEPMQFLSFEDETGLVETTFFPAAYRRFAMMLDWSRPYLLEGRVEENFGAVTVNVERVLGQPQSSNWAPSSSKPAKCLYSN